MAQSSYGLRGFEEGYVSDDPSLKDRMKQIYAETTSITQARWLQQSIDERFYAGDTSLWQEVYTQIPLSRRKQFNFNKIKNIVNMPAGYQRRNSKTLNVIPVESSDQETADIFSKTLMWVNNNANSYYTVSDAFLGSLITGMNLISIWMDFNSDPYSGDIRIDNFGYSGYMIDPYFKKFDLSDCNYIWTRKFVSKEQAIALLPERKKEIQEMTTYYNKDQFFNFLPENYNITRKNLLPYDEFWYLDSRRATIILDPINEMSMEWTGQEENLRMFMMKYPQLKKKTIYKPTCKLGICVNGQTMYNGKNPYNIDRFPFVPVIAYHQPSLPYYEWRYQGMVRGLRDSQFILNRRQQILLDVLESQINSGLKVMEGSLIDDADAFKTGQGQALFIKKDAPMGMESVQKIPPADISPAFMQVIDQMSQNMMSISGVNEELLGSAEDDKAGILSMLRQGAGLTTLQILFDNLDQSLINLGRIQIDMIQANFTPGKISKITEMQPTEQFYSRTFQKYDCQVVEGTDTPTQRMTAFKQGLYLKELGMPIPSQFLLEMSTLQNKGELVKEIQQQEQQAQQMQQMQAQLQMQELQSRIKLTDARATADQGLGIERLSRIQENKALAVERRAASIKDLEAASLDKIKAAKELVGMDLSQLKQLIDIVETLRKDEESESEEIVESNEQQVAE